MNEEEAAGIPPHPAWLLPKECPVCGAEIRHFVNRAEWSMTGYSTYQSVTFDCGESRLMDSRADRGSVQLRGQCARARDAAITLREQMAKIQGAMVG